MKLQHEGICSKKDLVVAQISSTNRTFADIQQKVTQDTTAGSKAIPLNVSGASVAAAGESFVGSCIHQFQTENLLCDRDIYDVNN